MRLRFAGYSCAEIVGKPLFYDGQSKLRQNVGSCVICTPHESLINKPVLYKYKMNSKRMLLRLLQQVFSFSLLFVHQLRPALSIIEESVEELIVERRSVDFDLFTVKMKTGRTCNATTCTSLGAHHLFLLGSSCSCQCQRYQPFTFLSSIQRCANTNQVRDFGCLLYTSDAADE